MRQAIQQIGGMTQIYFKTVMNETSLKCIIAGLDIDKGIDCARKERGQI